MYLMPHLLSTLLQQQSDGICSCLCLCVCVCVCVLEVQLDVSVLGGGGHLLLSIISRYSGDALYPCVGTRCCCPCHRYCC